MLRLNKQTISKYLENNCKRQLFLNLHKDSTLDNITYPQRLPRPAIQEIRRLGDQWEADKISDLRNAFGGLRVIESRIVTPGQVDRFTERDLLPDLNNAQPDTFVIQGQYQLPLSFRLQRGLVQYEQAPIALEYSELRPDVIWIRQPGTFSRYISDNGRVLDLPANDPRLQLQLIDIKLTSEASTLHFTEVAYYILALAGWLEENGLSDRFVVVPDGSVWPGSFDDSALTSFANNSRSTGSTPAIDELIEALQEDLEIVPFEPIEQRISTFFARDLIEAINAKLLGNWVTLPWHINQGCAACEFLGIDANPDRWHDNHCHPEAINTDRITKIPYLGRGGKSELEEQGVNTTAQLQVLPPTAQVFQDNSQLRADRRMLITRTEAINTGNPILPLGRRTTLLPESKDTDLKIFITLDFDPGSGLTYAFGFKAFWWNPLPSTHRWGIDPLPPATPPNKRQFVFIVPDRNPNSELTQLLAVCQAIVDSISQIGSALTNAGYTGAEAQPKVHFYIWDSVQAKHIRRVMGRHINSPQLQTQFQGLIWRFPPENLLPDAEMEQRSPVSVVKSAVRQLLGLPIRYDYSLLQAARVYRPNGVDENDFWVHPLFESGLGDQIPFERAHEIWSRRGYRNAAGTTFIPWNTLQNHMERAVEKKLLALECIVGRLERDLKNQSRLLLKPKSVSLRRPRQRRGMSADGQLWLSYALLGVVSEKLEILANRAMEVEEREAKYKAAVLETRLTGQEKEEVLARLNNNINPERVWVYRLRSTSADVKMDPDDFDWALSPVDFPGILDLSVYNLVNKDRTLALLLTGNPSKIYYPLENMTQVTIVDIDRENLTIVIQPDELAFLQAAETRGIVDFRQNVVLDNIHKDYWTGRLERCLRAIGDPSIATPDPATLEALNQRNRS